jgi:hypothetical protein
MGDRDALVYLYEMTQGHTSGWLNETNWDTELRLNLWHGVTVDEGAHVVSCILGSNRLTGDLPETSRLKGLVNMRSLYLDSNFLNGPVPKSLKDLTMLQELNLAWNKFSGRIPEEIYSLANLQVLRLDNNELEGTVSESIGNLTKLKLLNLCNNNLVGLIPKVGHKLKELRRSEFLPGNKFDGEVPTTAAEMKEHRPEIASDSRRSQLGSRTSSRTSSRASSRAGSRKNSRKEV